MKNPEKLACLGVAIAEKSAGDYGEGCCCQRYEQGEVGHGLVGTAHLRDQNWSRTL